MSNNKQSSVEFLEQKFISIFVNDEGFKKAIEQAKAMHREEIIDATCLNAYVNEDDREIGEHYYNETFGGNE